MTISLSRPFKIAGDVALSVGNGHIVSWRKAVEGSGYHTDGWVECYTVSGKHYYLLDLCALQLKHVELFIAICSEATGDSIESFSDKAVRRFIKQLNLEWEFVT